MIEARISNPEHKSEVSAWTRERTKGNRVNGVREDPWQSFRCTKSSFREERKVEKVEPFRAKDRSSGF